MTDDKPKPYNLKNPPHLIANEVLQSINYHSVFVARSIHAALEQLITQYQELLVEQEQELLIWARRKDEGIGDDQ